MTDMGWLMSALSSILGDYIQYQQLCINAARCRPCEQRHPSCVNEVDGFQPIRDLPDHNKECFKGRTLRINRCAVGHLFSYQLRRCVPISNRPVVKKWWRQSSGKLRLPKGRICTGSLFQSLPVNLSLLPILPCELLNRVLPVYNELIKEKRMELKVVHPCRASIFHYATSVISLWVGRLVKLLRTQWIRRFVNGPVDK